MAVVRPAPWSQGQNAAETTPALVMGLARNAIQLAGFATAANALQRYSVFVVFQDSWLAKE